MAQINWIELARPAAILPCEPPGKKLLPGVWAAVWSAGKKWLMLDSLGSICEVEPLDVKNLQDEIMPLLTRGITALLIKDNEPSGLLNTQIVIEELAAQKQRVQAFLDTLLDVTGEAVTVIGADHKVLGWSEKAQQLYKIKREEIVGRDIENFFTSLVVTTQLRQALSDKERVCDEYHQPMLGAHVMINAASVKCEGKLVGAIASEREITQTMRLANELARRQSQLQDLKSEIDKISRPTDAFSRIYGQSAALRRVLDMAKRIANTDVSILLRGESGTGKELFAEAIHKAGRRSQGPFVVINCGAIPAGLFESELFGYLPGSFTGADRKGRKGKFDEANQGAIFLDEIGELSLDMQVKLLHVLQNQRFTRVGGGGSVNVDVRLISATHRDLEQMIQEGSFREDLYYRLNVVSLEIPPLRERREDIGQLAYLFIQEFCARQDLPFKQLASEVLNYLVGYDWPGNIRELRNVAERLVALSAGGQILVEHLPSVLRFQRETPAAAPIGGLTKIADKVEQKTIMRALEKTQGSRTKAAALLGIPRSTLYYKMNKYGINSRNEQDSI